MGTPGRKDDVVRGGRDDDDDGTNLEEDDLMQEEEDPEEEEFEEDPEEIYEEGEEVGVGVETGDSDEDGVDGDEELQEPEEEEVEEEEEEEEENEVDELEEEVVEEEEEEEENEVDELEEEKLEEVDEEVDEIALENNEEDVEEEDEAEEEEEEDEIELELENYVEDIEKENKADELEEEVVEEEEEENEVDELEEEKLEEVDEEVDEVALENNEEDVEEEEEEDDEIELENYLEDIEKENKADGDEDEEENEVELENYEEDVEKKDEPDEDVEKDDEADEDEVEVERNEENVENGGEVEEEDQSSIPPMISSEKDATDILAGEQQNGLRGDTDGPGNLSEDTGDIDPLIFTKAESLKNENVDCGHEAEGVNEMESDCGNKITSHHVNEKDVKDIGFHAMRQESKGSEATESVNTDTPILVESGASKYDQVNHRSDGDGVKEIEFNEERVICQELPDKGAENINICARHSEPMGIEAAEFFNINPPSYFEAAPVKNEKVDRASESIEVRRMDSDCEEKERHLSNKDAESIDVCAPSSELKGTAETAKPLSSTWLDSKLVFMQEGGVEDMDLDSEENIVHGADADGTVVDSIQENTALNSQYNASFSTGTYALGNETVARNVMSLTSGGEDTMHNHKPNLGEGKIIFLDPKEHTTLKPSSMAATLGKQRFLPPVTQGTDSNKRPAIKCNYYAKGWCIKGNSCRFLHVTENKDSSYKQQERGPASANGEKQVSEGVGDGSKIIFPDQHAESYMHKLNNTLSYPPIESRLLHSEKPDFGVGVVASSSAFTSKLTPPNVNAALFNDPLQSIANRYINQHLHPTVLTDVYSSRYISPINGSSNSVVSLNPSPYDAHKILSGSRDFNASSSSFGLISERDRLNSLGLPPKAEMNKWEPSKPFRPSYYFSIPSGSTPGSMYDPLRDSIEHTSVGVESYRAEPINYPSNGSYPDSAANNFEMDGYNGTLPDRYGYSRATGLQLAEAEAAESSVADQGDLGSALGGDRGSGTSYGKYLSETNKTNNVSAEKKSKRLEEKIHSNGMDVERGLAAVDQGESKTFRQFRVALIDFTKELLKPAWRVGKMSKDAHNLIVKKTVTKVLSSLHSHQVPSTPDLVQQYLSGSQPKITKLLEAYVQKHNKT